MTYAEIGLILGISRSRVKQIEKEALLKIRRSKHWKILKIFIYQ